MRRSTSPPRDDSKDHKIFSRSKWRGKIFSSSEKKDEKQWEDQQSQDNDIAQFLGNSSRKDDERLLDTPLDPRNLGSGSPERRSDGRPFTPPAPRNLYHRAKPRQNKGLHVKFTTTAPEIIGEGGDNADSPPIVVSAKAPTLPQVTLSFESPPDFDSKPVPEPPMKTSADEKPAQATARPYLSSRSQSQRLRRRSVQDIGDVHPSALKSGRSEDDEVSPPISPISPLSDGDDAVPYFNRPTRQYTLDAGTISPPEVDSIGNSLTPSASPEPSSITVESQDSPQRSRGTGNTGPANQTHGNLYPVTTSPRSGEPHLENRVQSRSIRKAAKELGADAIDDFDSRVSRFEELFRLGATVHQDVTQIPFRRWLRAALWWFLKGRGALEVEVRSQMRGASGSEHAGVPPGLKQAYVDLSKAWWIVKSITPKHPEIKRYGNTSVKSMVAILRNFGNKELADLAQRHVDLVANLKALAMSMKRNERLPPVDLEIQRLDVKVLLDEVQLPSDVQEVLSRSTVHAHSKTQSLSLPLGDSSKYFAFTRLFGTGSILSKDQSWDPILLPCVLSLVRMKDSLELVGSICSQDGEVDIVIQAEETHDIALTWKDVNWSTSGNFVSVMISRDIDLVLQLLASDFKALWTICDYTRKVQKDFAGRRGEDLMFETPLQTFQCVNSTQQASSFPLDPITSCSVRLFNVTKTFSDGKGLVQSGLRLMARTPPEIKTLSSISQSYGDDAPTLFGFSPRQERPRLSIRAPGSSTLILTFLDWEQLDSFYSLFTQRQPMEYEQRSPPLLLQEAEIFTYDEDSNRRRQHVQDIRWSQLRVIWLKSSGSAVTSPADRWHNLRLISQCDIGIITDHFALGEDAKCDVWLNIANHISPGRTKNQSQCARLQQDHVDATSSTRHVRRTYGLRPRKGRHRTLARYDMDSGSIDCVQVLSFPDARW